MLPLLALWWLQQLFLHLLAVVHVFIALGVVLWTRIPHVLGKVQDKTMSLVLKSQQCKKQERSGRYQAMTVCTRRKQCVLSFQPEKQGWVAASPSHIRRSLWRQTFPLFSAVLRPKDRAPERRWWNTSIQRGSVASAVTALNRALEREVAGGRLRLLRRQPRQSASRAPRAAGLAEGVSIPGLGSLQCTYHDSITRLHC